MSDLYDADIVVWSEAQAVLLRRLAAGEPRPSLPLECPWSLGELLCNESDGA